MAPLCRRRLALRDDLVNRREPAFLKSRALAVREGEGVVARRNTSNRFGRPGPSAYSRNIWLNVWRSLLSGMENKARKTASKAVS